jgi:integrase
MPKIKLTQIAIERLKPPAAGRVEFWDSQLPGFGLRVAAPRDGQPGRKTWQVMYRVHGRQVRETLGTLATIPNVATARDLARLSMRKAQAGTHPVAERRQQDRARSDAAATSARENFAAAIDRYLQRHAAKRMRASSLREISRVFERDVKPVLGARSIRDITRRDIRELLEQIVDRGAPIHANHVLSYLGTMFKWALSNDLVETSPAVGLQRPSPAVERDRALDDDEIRLFWLACDQQGWPFGPLFQLLLLTAQRRAEVAASRWPEFDFDKALWTLPRERAKNDKAHLVHLAPAALDVLGALPKVADDLVFTTTGTTSVTGFARALERVMRFMQRAAAQQGRAAIAPFTLHDLRRTAATGMAGIGIAPHIVDRILNHTAGTISGVARIYNRAEYLDERKAALVAWSSHVERLTGHNVIALTAAAGERDPGRARLQYLIERGRV